MSSPTHWSLPFLQTRDEASRCKTALIILNQPFSNALLRRLWHATDWHCCADGGANRLHDVLNGDRVDDCLPDLLKGDLDSVREDVRQYYETRVSRCYYIIPCSHVCRFRKGVRVIRDDDQNSTDLMKCVQSLQEKEEADGVDVGGGSLLHARFPAIPRNLYFENASFSDSLRRRLTWWLLWATRSDRPFIIVSTQAPEKRTSTVRRR